MPNESNSKITNITALSQANISYEATSMRLDGPEERFMALVSRAVDECLVKQNKHLSEQNHYLNEKLERIENSINRMVNQFEAIRRGEAEDSALRVTTDLNATDLALSSVSLPKEEFYPYTCNQMAEYLNVRPYDVQVAIKNLALRNEPKYHICIRTGTKGKVNKWSEAALNRIQEVLEERKGQFGKKWTVRASAEY